MAQEEPAGHGVHAVALAREYCPLAHATGDADELPHAEPRGHGVHTAALVRAYAPTAHATGAADVDAHA